MRKHRHLKRFTLVELLVSMAVFSILLMISMRLFSGAQQLWLSSENKTNAFADARIAMEFVASRMQSLLYSNEYPFYIASDKIMFVSKMPLGNNYDADSHWRRFIMFSLSDPEVITNDTAGNLQMSVYQGKNSRRRYGWLFPPYGSANGNRYFNDADDALAYAYSAIHDPDDSDVIDIIENVVDLKFVWYDAEYNDSATGSDWDFVLASAASSISPPFLVEVEISIMNSRDNFIKWQDASSTSERNDIFAENGYTFRRAVLIGKRSAQ